MEPLTLGIAALTQLVAKHGREIAELQARMAFVLEQHDAAMRVNEELRKILDTATRTKLERGYVDMDRKERMRAYKRNWMRLKRQKAREGDHNGIAHHS